MDNGPEGFRRKIQNVTERAGVSNAGWGKVPNWSNVMRRVIGSLPSTRAE